MSLHVIVRRGIDRQKHELRWDEYKDKHVIDLLNIIDFDSDASYSVIYNGRDLTDYLNGGDSNMVLSEIGLSENSLVYLIKLANANDKKFGDEKISNAFNLTDDQSKSFLKLFRNAIKNHSSFVEKIQSLSNDYQLINKFINDHKHDLNLNDYATSVLVTKLDAVIMYLNEENVHSIFERHPSLYRILKLLHDQNFEKNSKSMKNSTTESAIRFSNPFDFEAESEEDEQSENPRMQQPPINTSSTQQQQQPFTPLNSNALAAALAQVQSRTRQEPPSSLQPSSSAQSSVGQSTPESLMAALTNAMSRGGHSNVALSPIPQTVPELTQSSAGGMEDDLQRMRELGISEEQEGLARQALQVMEGDVQAAVDLILSGWEGND